MAQEFTDQNFQKETSKGFAIVDFWAPWCGPCQMMSPIFDEVAVQFKGKVKMGKVNVDDNQQIPSKYGVSGIPTIIFLKDGAEASRLVGFQSKETFQAKILEVFGVK